MRVTVAGVEVDVEVDEDDAYSQAAGAHALALDGYAHILRTLPSNPVIFDVGANMGLSALAAAITRPDARILAFEPGPTTVARLRHNTSAYPHVEVIHAAVSDKAGSLRFHTSAYSAGSHVVASGHMVDYMPCVDVPAVTLDAISVERNLRPNFIKIDVEGHEPEVLAGARSLIAALNPLIFMEFNSWTLNAFAGHSPAAFAKALWRTFDIADRTDPLGFLHDNLLKEGCVSDLSMRLKAGCAVPSLREMSLSADLDPEKPDTRDEEIVALRKRVRDLETSTSWKITAPLRSVAEIAKTALGRR